MADQKTITTLIWIIFAGICFGAFYAYYHRRLVGDIVRAIIKSEAYDSSSAVTLKDIGYGSGIKYSFARFALKKGSSARSIVQTVYEEKAPEKKHEDELFVGNPRSQDEQKYYIQKDKLKSAQVKYKGKGTSLATVLITVAVFFAIALTAISFLPWILSNAGSLLGEQKGQDNPPQTDEIVWENEEIDTAPESETDGNENDAVQNEDLGLPVNTDEKTGIATVDPSAVAGTQQNPITE